MNFQAVKGTRDFYPNEMRLRNWITDAWRRVSLRNGFEEYDSPIFEYLDLYTAKSGDEIVSQLFAFEDRGGRKLAIRPEITPSLARMVNAKINSLPRPIKWFSVPRLCRGEKPQKGRLREFFQWNVDVIGANEVLADAECIFTCVDFLREIGLTAQDVEVRIGSRRLVCAILQSVNVDQETIQKVLPVLDRRGKIPQEVFREQLLGAGLKEDQFQHIESHLSVPPKARIQHLFALSFRGGEFSEAAQEIITLWKRLEEFGIVDYLMFDLSVVRGLAYYTSIVYEVFDAAGSMRAIAGGGRYDNLLKVLGGPEVAATGFGMGDVVLGILLEEKGKIPTQLQAARLDYFVIDAEDSLPAKLQVVAALRGKGLTADFSYRYQAVGKQFKTANQRGAKKVVIIQAGGQSAAVKDLATGQQTEMSLKKFLQEL
jgi:histidyl-tRNA synthetase